MNGWIVAGVLYVLGFLVTRLLIVGIEFDAEHEDEALPAPPSVYALLWPSLAVICGFAMIVGEWQARRDLKRFLDDGDNDD